MRQERSVRRKNAVRVSGLSSVVPWLHPCFSTIAAVVSILFTIHLGSQHSLNGHRTDVADELALKRRLRRCPSTVQIRFSGGKDEQGPPNAPCNHGLLCMSAWSMCAKVSRRGGHFLWMVDEALPAPAHSKEPNFPFHLVSRRVALAECPLSPTWSSRLARISIAQCRLFQRGQIMSMGTRTKSPKR
jgi:hypothetical protein